MTVKFHYQLEGESKIKMLKYENVIGLSVENLNNHLYDNLTVITFKCGDEVKTATFYTNRIIAGLLIE